MNNMHVKLPILSAEKKITFRRDLGLLPTENSKRTLEDVFRRECIEGALI